MGYMGVAMIVESFPNKNEKNDWKKWLFIPPTLTFKSYVFDSQPYFLVKDEIFPLKT